MMNLNLVPMVIEQSARGERSFDIFSRLLRDRIVFVNGPIDDTTAALDAMVASASYAPYGGLDGYMKLGYVPIDGGLLELYRKGEITWEQGEPFGPIQVRKTVAAA